MHRIASLQHNLKHAHLEEVILTIFSRLYSLVRLENKPTYLEVSLTGFNTAYFCVDMIRAALLSVFRMVVLY